MESSKKHSWTPTRRFGMASMGLIYVILGFSWWYLPARPELHEYFVVYRPYMWVAVGVGSIVTAQRRKEPFIFLNLMGALAFERLFVLTFTAITEKNLGLYSAVWYLALWLGTCYAYLLPSRTAAKHVE